MKKLAHDGLALVRLPSWVRPLPKHTAIGRLGYKVVPGMLTPEECERIRHDCDVAIHQQLPSERSGAYVVSRRRAQTGLYDRYVFQLMKYEAIAPWIVQRLADTASRTFRDETGLDLKVGTYSVQVDWPDMETKRPYHNDGFNSNFKLFIYLSDVDCQRNGPYCVIPGSHRHYLRKWKNFARYAIGRSPNPDDMTAGYTDDMCTKILGPAGTGIFSCQALAHKGWQGHNSRKRYVLVVYLAPNAEPANWALGREFALTDPVTEEEAASPIRSAIDNELSILEGSAT
jgi:hypothetical protein